MLIVGISFDSGSCWNNWNGEDIYGWIRNLLEGKDNFVGGRGLGF